MASIYGFFLIGGYVFWMWFVHGSVNFIKFVMNNNDNDMPSYDNSTPYIRVLIDVYANPLIIMLIAGLQVLVTGSLHLVGDVLKLLKRWYKLMTVPKMMIIQNILLLICTTLIFFFIPIVEAAEVSNVTVKPGQTKMLLL